MIKTNNQSVSKPRQKFDQTFKREAVNNWLTSGKSASMVAVELGILPNRLYAWRVRFAPADAGGKAATGAKLGSVAELQTQLEAARREIRHLTEQRDTTRYGGDTFIRTHGDGRTFLIALGYTILFSIR
jgi:transposase-like protein